MLAYSYAEIHSVIPATTGPTCSEITIGPRAQSFRTGSQDTDIKNPISSIESLYEEVISSLTSMFVPLELVCTVTFVLVSLFAC